MKRAQAIGSVRGLPGCLAWCFYICPGHQRQHRSIRLDFCKSPPRPRDPRSTRSKRSSSVGFATALHGLSTWLAQCHQHLPARSTLLIGLPANLVWLPSLVGGGCSSRGLEEVKGPRNNVVQRAARRWGTHAPNREQLHVDRSLHERGNSLHTVRQLHNDWQTTPRTPPRRG
jgi:hypothetical protein